LAEKDTTLAVDPVDWTKVRKARPLDQLLPATERWADSLPRDVRPNQLLRIYPRIANRIAFAWPDPKALQEVLDDVLIDRRGGRKGFPPFVLSELLRLREGVDGAHSLTLRP
jgi:hypothetical protein